MDMDALADRSDTNTRRVFAYFGPLTLLVFLAEPVSALLDIATSYVLKNNLHATATQVATFRLVTAIPVYLALVFGLARDWWNPLGLRDRGFLLIFAPLTAAIFTAMAFAPVSYRVLIVGTFLVMLSFRFVAAAYQGLLALVGQEQLMSGRLSVLFNVVSYLPAVGGAFLAGYVAEHVTPAKTFLLMAGLSLLIAGFGVLNPRAIFRHVYDQPLARRTTITNDMKRLVRHRAIYPTVLIMFVFQFSPGTYTVLQYHLTNDLHASDAVYGYWYGIWSIGFMPVFLGYGYLCQKLPFRKLLWWGTLLCIPQMLPLAFIHSITSALWLAIPMGLLGGIVVPAIYDLAMRSSPPGLQGTMMMLIAGVNFLAQRGGDLVGTWIYGSSSTHGFLYCALATVASSALILPLISLVPAGLIATADGEPNAELLVDNR